jgi:(S)-sulfolactate dehydrogenase
VATIVVSEFMATAGRAMLEERHTVRYDPALHAEPDRLRGLLGDAAALIVRNQTEVDAGLLGAAPRLLTVGRLGAGLDNIDLAACEARDVTVHTAGGANAIAVAEYVVGALLLLARGALRMTDVTVAGAWPRDQVAGHELAGRQLGLIGFGAIAREVAVRAAALGMQVAASDPYLPATDPAWSLAESVPFPRLLASSDAVSIHVPLTNDTRGLLDGPALAALPAGALLVNTSRGGIVDETALIAALRSGALGGAALDVFASEPLDAAAGARFADIPNVILSPHVAGHTPEANERISRTVATAVLAALDGAA